MKDMERIRSQIQRATSLSGLQSAAAQAVAPPAPGSSEVAPPPSFASAAAGRPTDRTNPEAQTRARGGMSPAAMQDTAAVAAAAGQLNLGRAPGGLGSLEKELLGHDATAASRPKGKRTITETLPSGADVIVECLTQQRFNRDVRDFLRKNE